MGLSAFSLVFSSWTAALMGWDKVTVAAIEEYSDCLPSKSLELLMRRVKSHYPSALWSILAECEQRLKPNTLQVSFCRFCQQSSHQSTPACSIGSATCPGHMPPPCLTHDVGHFWIMPSEFPVPIILIQLYLGLICPKSPIPELGRLFHPRHPIFIKNGCNCKLKRNQINRIKILTTVSLSEYFCT